MIDKKITERFLKRRIRKYIRLGNLLIIKDNIRTLGFCVKREFLSTDFSLNDHFSIKIYEPFMLIRVKTAIQEDFIIIGLEFLQNDSIGWLMRSMHHDKMDVIEFIKDLKRFEQWKI